MVVVTMTGLMEMISIKLDVPGNDPELTADLIVAAHADAYKKIRLKGGLPE